MMMSPSTPARPQASTIPGIVAAGDRFPVWIDGIDRPIAGSEGVFQDGPPERPLPFRGADYGDRPWIEDLLQITHAIPSL
jgi:hypothetical protein